VRARPGPALDLDGGGPPPRLRRLITPDGPDGCTVTMTATISGPVGAVVQQRWGPLSAFGAPPPVFSRVAALSEYSTAAPSSSPLRSPPPNPRDPDLLQAARPPPVIARTH